MGSLSLELDATGSAIGGGNPDGTAYALSSANGYSLLSLEAPEPEQDIQWASSADTQGELAANQRYRNRVITARFRLAKASDAALQSEINTLTKKVGKLVRESGTLKITVPSGTVCYADVLNASHGFPWDQRFLRIQRGEITLSLPCAPFLRTAEQDLGDNVETTLPWLIFTEASIPGDVPALGRLLIDNDAGSTRQYFVWGQQSRYYDAAATAALFYQAESCALGTGTSAVAGPAGASGAGSNVARNTTLSTSPTSPGIIYLGTSSTAQTHVGTFRVFARVQPPNTNTGVLSFRVGWLPYTSYSTTSANFNETRVLSNDGTTSGDPTAWEAVWSIVDLGLITLPYPLKGTPAWIGMLHVWSTVSNDDIDIDWIALVPVDEGYGLAGIDGLGTAEQIELRHNGVVKSLASAWRDLSSYEGDDLLVPPSGAEGRTTRVILRLGANPRSASTTGFALDSDIPDMSARLFVTPRYLTLPA